MPKYYFHIKDPHGTTPDLEGIDFANLDEVRNEATLAAREILSELVLSGKDLGNQAFIVENEAGETVLEYPFQLSQPG
jgi:hypothetical protein